MRILKLILFICFPVFLSAQEIEVGLALGGSNYYGDLAPYPVLSETHFAYSLYGRYNISPSFAFTASIMNGEVSGNDKNFSYNNDRNLNFHSQITEYAAIMEFNFLKYGVGVLDKRFTPYTFIGLAVFEFNPQTSINGQTVDLRNVRTEGVSYGNYSWAIPFGIGLKWQFHRLFAFEANIGFRKTYTDYLDDVSTVYPDLVAMAQKQGGIAVTLSDRSAELHGGIPQNKKGYRRGNQDFSDWYLTSTVSLSYRIYRKIKCARFY